MAFCSLALLLFVSCLVWPADQWLLGVLVVCSVSVFLAPVDHRHLILPNSASVTCASWELGKAALVVLGLLEVVGVLVVMAEAKAAETLNFKKGSVLFFDLF